eukprot:TRINITY_DN1624_c0_g2_i4.p1 TRINITY_DN1624_c0_g2~~TRINITY_DN1624_c0_g2_i4.p1  ORF type:complete len:362 (+),score=21.29 TRINITY_DN1624_c0_g2_i4:145-1086(+)
MVKDAARRSQNEESSRNGMAVSNMGQIKGQVDVNANAAKVAVTIPSVIPVFYNVYKDPSDTISLADDIVKEQISYLRPEHSKVFVNSIGSPVEVQNASLIQHRKTGGEMDTLALLWQHCQEHVEDTVVYMHNKGSFHPSETQGRWRRFLSRGALSEECSNMPASCDVCSSRMSPLPHVHCPGNMWAARCAYIQKLLERTEFQKKMDSYHANKTYPESCVGAGRYAAEAWVHSHPSVQPCDLSTDYHILEYPEGDFVKKLEPAPRFGLDKYKQFKPWRCPDRSLEERLQQYQSLYNERPAENWWGWKLFESEHL